MSDNIFDELEHYVGKPNEQIKSEKLVFIYDRNDQPVS